MVLFSIIMSHWLRRMIEENWFHMTWFPLGWALWPPSSFVLFSAGSVFAHFVREVNVRRPILIGVLCDGLFLLYACQSYVLWHPREWKWLDWHLRTGHLAVAALLFGMTKSKSSIFHYLFSLRPLVALSPHSLSIYMIHPPIIYWCRHFLQDRERQLPRVKECMPFAKMDLANPCTIRGYESVVITVLVLMIAVTLTHTMVKINQMMHSFSEPSTSKLH